MREILFRGKTTVEPKIWVKGYLVSNNKIKGSMGTAKVDENTIGQFTGFYTSDNQRIFEGDILKDSESNYVYLMKWFTEYGCYGLANSSGHLEEDTDINIYLPSLYIIGNVHENPELLSYSEYDDIEFIDKRKAKS